MQEQNLKRQLMFVRMADRIRERENTLNQSVYLKIYKKCAPFRSLSISLLILMPFFRYPVWLKNDQKLDDTEYPSSNIPRLEQKYFYIIQLILILILTPMKCLKYKFIKHNTNMNLRLICLILLTIAMIINILIFYLFKQNLYFDVFSIPIYFIVYNRTIRRTLLFYAKIIKNSLKFFFLMFFNLILFTCIGFLVFKQWKIPKDQIHIFQQFQECLYALIVLQTTANYPDVMFPYYKISSFAVIYFIVYLIISFMFLTNLLIAIFYSTYKEIVQQYSQKVRGNIKLRQKLQRQIKRNLSFYKLPQYFRARQNLSSVGLILYKIFTSKVYEPVLGLISGVNVFIIAFITKQTQENQHVKWQIVCFTINFFFLIQSILKLYVFGKAFKKRYFDLYELFVSIIIMIGIIILFSISYYQKNVLSYLMLLKLLRFIRILFTQSTLNKVIISAINFTPFLIDIFSIIFTVFYFFASLGMFLFGGQITYDTMNKLDKQKQNYIYNNYNDLLNSFITQFSLLIVNNWINTVEMYVKVMGSKFYRIYFIFFYYVVVLLCYNIMIAFIIEHTVTSLKIQKQAQQVQNKKKKQYKQIQQQGQTIQFQRNSIINEV